ncbi:MAG TPA: hypothetical protein VEJ38_01335 [Candidatus Acidoferrales bacterium]|nr:hypothetical protein [Candidatus Acidoferrales bacterium]
MIAIWAVVTLVLIALSIHRSIFVMREEDTIFVSPAEGATKEHYATTMQRLKRLETVLKIFSFASGILTVLIAALWLYQKLYG